MVEKGTHNTILADLGRHHRDLNDLNGSGTMKHIQRSTFGMESSTKGQFRGGRRGHSEEGGEGV